MTENDKMSPDSAPGDDDSLLDHCALECMRAIEMKDKEAFKEAFDVLVADLLNRMRSDSDKPKE